MNRKLKSKSDQKKKKKRKARAVFRPTFRDRCVFSFAKCLGDLNEIIDLRSEAESQPGMLYVSCYKNLSHSIEMLCKATLEQRSPYLVLKKLDSFDALIPKEDALSDYTCVASVALARASKLFRDKFFVEELRALERIIESRNACEHGEFSIPNYRSELQYIASALEISKKIYNSQFREANLLEECREYISEEAVEVCDKIVQESSDEFKKIQSKVERLKKQKCAFMNCHNCYYPFAKLNSGGDKYLCLWCNDERIKKTCAVNDCKREFWISEDDKSDKCGHFHIGDGLLSKSLETFGTTLNPYGNLSEQLQIAAGSSLLSANESVLKIAQEKYNSVLQSVNNSFSPWEKLGKVTNPKGANDEKEPDEPKENNKKDDDPA